MKKLVSTQTSVNTTINHKQRLLIHKVYITFSCCNSEQAFPNAYRLESKVHRTTNVLEAEVIVHS